MRTIVAFVFRLGNIEEMAGRVKCARKMLRDRLEAIKTPGTWTHITDQIGMFCYTGLSGQSHNNSTVVTTVKRWVSFRSLITKYHIYLLKSGRINVCGLNKKNVDYVAKAIDDVVRNVTAV